MPHLELGAGPNPKERKWSFIKLNTFACGPETVFQPQACALFYHHVLFGKVGSETSIWGTAAGLPDPRKATFQIRQEDSLALLVVGGKRAYTRQRRMETLAGTLLSVYVNINGICSRQDSRGNARNFELNFISPGKRPPT